MLWQRLFATQQEASKNPILEKHVLRSGMSSEPSSLRLTHDDQAVGATVLDYLVRFEDDKVVPCKAGLGSYGANMGQLTLFRCGLCC